MNKYIIFLLFSVFISSISQLLLKISANKSYKSLAKEYINPYVIIAYIMFFVSTLFTLFALTAVEYKNVPIVESLGYIFVIIFSRLVLNEKLSKKKIIGNFLILLGIFIFYI